MCTVQEMLSDFFNGKKLNKSINPDEAVVRTVPFFCLRCGENVLSPLTPQLSFWNSFVRHMAQQSRVES